MNNLRIIIPKGATDEIDLGLVELTEAISQLNLELVSHGVLGGTYGYGAVYENDVL